MQAQLLTAAALRFEMLQLARLTEAAKEHGLTSPQARDAESAFQVSGKQREAAAELHAQAATEFLQVLEEHRRSGGQQH